MLLTSIPAAVGRDCVSLDSRSVLCAHVNRPLVTNCVSCQVLIAAE